MREFWIAALAAVLLLPYSLSAQSFALESKSRTAFMLEIFKPTLREELQTRSRNAFNYSFRTLALFFSLRQQVKSHTFFVLELPFAHAFFDTIRREEFELFLEYGNSNQMGNLYLGLEKAKPESRFSSELGIRLPLVNAKLNRAASIGLASDYDRREAFQHFATVRATISYRSQRAEGWKFHARGGFAVHRDFDNPRDHYLTLPFNFEVCYAKPRLAVGILLPARVEMSYKTTSLNNRSPSRSFKLNQLQKWSIFAAIKLGRVRVGAAIPFQDSEQAFPPEFELNLNVQIASKR